MDLIIDNIEEAIVNTKKQLKSALPDLKEIFKDVEHYISEEVSIIEASIHEGKSVIPEILYQDIENGNIDLDTIDLVKKRGCVVIRNVFSKSLIDEWKSRYIKSTYANNRNIQRNTNRFGSSKADTNPSKTPRPNCYYQTFEIINSNCRFNKGRFNS